MYFFGWGRAGGANVLAAGFAAFVGTSPMSFRPGERPSKGRRGMTRYGPTKGLAAGFEMTTGGSTIGTWSGIKAKGAPLRTPFKSSSLDSSSVQLAPTNAPKGHHCQSDSYIGNPKVKVKLLSTKKTQLNA
jgi:hypothetical protein